MRRAAAVYRRTDGGDALHSPPKSTNRLRGGRTPAHERSARAGRSPARLATNAHLGVTSDSGGARRCTVTSNAIRRGLVPGLEIETAAEGQRRGETLRANGAPRRGHVAVPQRE